MKGSRLSLLCLSMTLVCTILAFIWSVVASNRQMGVTMNWLLLMDFLTPTLILGSALTIYFVHKAHTA